MKNTTTTSQVFKSYTEKFDELLATYEANCDRIRAAVETATQTQDASPVMAITEEMDSERVSIRNFFNKCQPCNFITLVRHNKDGLLALLREFTETTDELQQWVNKVNAAIKGK